MLSKSHPIILFIDRFGFSVYQDTFPGIRKFNFTQDTVANLDVVDRAQLTNLITSFIQVNKIVPSSLAAILSDDIIYIKDLSVSVQKPSLVPNQKVNQSQNKNLGQNVIQAQKTDTNGDKDYKDDVQKFLEKIPFEDVLAKTIKSGNVNRVVAVNKDLVMTVINVFVDRGSTVDAITPGFMFGQGIKFTAGLTPEIVKLIFGNMEIFRSVNLLTDPQKINPFQVPGSESKEMQDDSVKKPQNIRQYLLIGVFVILIIILVIVLFTSGILQPTASPKVKVPAVRTPVVSPVVKITLTPSPVSTTSADLKSIKIKIVRSSQAAEKATSLKAGLLGMGYQDVAIQASGTSVSEKSSVAFSQNIPMDLRNSMVAEVKEILPGLIILETQDLDSTINILIGKS
jgi:hypothetical protein